MRARSRIALIVDADPLSRHQIARTFELAGWLAYEAFDTHTAAEIAAGLSRLDLLLTELRLPDDGSGFDVAKRCRERFPQTAVIYYSAIQADQVLKIPDGEILRKPLNIPTLVSTANELIERSENPDGSAAFGIVETYHVCWSNGDVAGMMACCHDDILVRLNTADRDGGPLELKGKADFAPFLLSIIAVAECKTLPTLVGFNEGVLRTRVEAKIHHRLTGHCLESSYRQIIRLQDNKITSSHEFHDAAKIQAFWSMVGAEVGNRAKLD